MAAGKVICSFGSMPGKGTTDAMFVVNNVVRSLGTA